MIGHRAPGEDECGQTRGESAHQNQQAPKLTLPAAGVMKLQRTAGNQAVGRLLQRLPRLEGLVGDAHTVQLKGSQSMVGTEPAARLATSQRVVQRFPIKKVVWKGGLSDEDKRTLDDILKQTTKTEDLTTEQIEALRKLYEGNNARGSGAAELRRVLDLKSGKVTEIVEPDPESEEHRQTRHARLIKEGLDRLGGQKPWAELAPKINEWWQDFKTRERQENFTRAFRANRMTARQIDLGGRGGTFQVDTLAKTKGRFMNLARGPKGVEERLKPSNFINGQENEKGLHDLSASLLDGAKPIYQQLKHYENSVVLFMPVPEEDDLKVFAALNQLPDRDRDLLRRMGAEMTRLKLAQASDMGTTYADVSKVFGLDEFQYGQTGTIIRRKGGIGMPATPAEIKARETNALEYKKILTANITIVNEVVMAYRQHASKLFPMYARWDEVGNMFHVLTKDLKPVGYYITNDDGALHKGAPPPAISGGLVRAQESLRRERYLWEHQAYIAEHLDDEQALRQYFASLSHQHRTELKEAYSNNVFLGAKVYNDTMLRTIKDIEDLRNYQSFIAQHQGDHDTLRIFLRGIGKQQRQKLKTAYAENLDLGTEVSPQTRAAVPQIIDDIVTEDVIALVQNHSYIAQHQDDDEALRDFLTLIGRQRRGELKKAYTDNIFLGSKISPQRARAIVQIIDGIEYDIGLGHIRV